MYDKEFLISCIAILIPIGHILKNIVKERYTHYNKLIDCLNLNWRHYNYNSIAMIDKRSEHHVTSRMKWTKMNRKERNKHDKEVHKKFDKEKDKNE